MIRPRLPGLLPISLLVFAAILTAWLGLWGPLDLRKFDAGAIATILGAVLTSAVTGIAIFFAARSIRQQISIELFSREEDRIEAQLPGLRAAFEAMGTCNFTVLSFAIDIDRSFDVELDRSQLDASVNEIRLAIGTYAALTGIPDAMKGDFVSILEFLARNAARAANARLAAQSIFDTEGQPFTPERIEQGREVFRRQLAALKTTIQVAEETRDKLGARIQQLRLRQEIFSREIAKLLPTGRD